jgi:hypothetical protein
MSCRSAELLGNAGLAGFQEAPSLTPLTRPYRNEQPFVATVPVLQRHVMVLSQCCEIAAHNGKIKRHYFVVAPLSPVLDVQRRADDFPLLEQNDPGAWLHYYFVAASPPLEQDFVVDFGRLMSLPKDEYSFVLSRKILQLTDSARLVLKTKLGQYYGRLTAEELSEQDGQPAETDEVPPADEE